MTKKSVPSTSNPKYEIGYGRPPKATQFKLGGKRPARKATKPSAKSQNDLFWAILQEPCRVKRNGKAIWMSKAALIVERAFALAEQGNATLRRLMIDLLLVPGPSGDPPDFIFEVDENKPAGCGTYKRLIRP